LINAPLAQQTQQVAPNRGPLGATYAAAQAARSIATQLETVVAVFGPSLTRNAHSRALLSTVHNALRDDIKGLATAPQGDVPITLGIGEPLSTTATVSLIFALILTLPVLLGQAFAFLTPALAPQQRRRLRPLTLAVPGLFIAGVAFGYFVVLPAAVRFFVNFDSSQFNVLFQAAPYYKFAATTILAMGLLFEIPLAIIAIAHAGLITPHQFRRKRRYAVGACALVAAFLPGDVITMLLETVPPYLLFELGVALAALFEHRSAREGRP
jgi:sec-independent protein translocase protein TatC